MEISHECLHDAVRMLQEKGYLVEEVIPGQILGPNQMLSPKVTVVSPRTIKTTPKMWSHITGAEKQDKRECVHRYVYSCRFSFSPDYVKEVDVLESILAKRHECLKGWANRLPEVPIKKV